jgi:hypothetical protein
MHAAFHSAAFLILILLADFAITLLHSSQEWKGAGAPLWRNFGAIVGLDISDRWGFWIFTVALTVILFAVGFTGIVGLPIPQATGVALGGLIGARLSDTLVSHILLHCLGYRPNPGLSSTPLYVFEALFIAWIFRESLAAAPGYAALGFGFGVLAFVAVLPLLRVARMFFPARERPSWQPWQPIPPWAAANL